MGRDDLTAVLRSGPFHLALRAAIEARGLALQRIQFRLAEQGLHVGVATLSYWQQGRRRPERQDSLRAVSALEEILGLPPSALTVLLGPPRPRGRGAGLPAGARRYAELIAPISALDRILADLDSPDGRLHTVSLFEDVEVGPDRSAVRRRCLHVVKAHQEVDRYVTIFHGDAGCDASQIHVVPVANCRLGRTRRDLPEGLVVAELLFDRTLRIGETHILEYEIRDGSGVLCRDYHRGVRFPTGQLVIQVRFAPGVLPVRCYQYTKKFIDGPDVDRTELTVTGHRTVHMASMDVAPGISGIRWDWE
ncbi:helix-turn-helix domain-containing protein [Longispora albida]|uniref:helix-turn-helix domain-containing protein n=1 Tax=Longispora albida TaxID=203523 RepID=UPI0003829C2D|nr:helix-turn-helix transcriptional regulator [Longispora albida]